MSREKKISLSLQGSILPGSISIAYLPCGKKTCLCKTHQKYWHGPYYRWSGFIDGKRTTKNIHPSILKECKLRMKNYKKLVALWNKIIRASIADAPWNSKILNNPP